MQEWQERQQQAQQEQQERAQSEGGVPLDTDDSEGQSPFPGPRKELPEPPRDRRPDVHAL